MHGLSLRIPRISCHRAATIAFRSFARMHRRTAGSVRMGALRFSFVANCATPFPSHHHLILLVSLLSPHLTLLRLFQDSLLALESECEIAAHKKLANVIAFRTKCCALRLPLGPPLLVFKLAPATVHTLLMLLSLVKTASRIVLCY